MINRTECTLDLIKEALRAPDPEIFIHWASHGFSDGLHMVGRSPRRNCDCTDSMACVDPVVDYQKHAREVLSDSLRGCISGLLLKDVR
jgi:hypothetical protein